MNYYHFKLGDFSCTAVSDGGLNYPIAPLANGVPIDKIQSVLTDWNLPTTHIYTPYTCLYIDTGQNKVLIDTGVGESLGIGVKNMFPDVDNSQTVAGTLAQNLQSAGVMPTEIDTVIVTHAHPDHVGGNLDMSENLVYPNAQFYIWKEEWDFWSSDEQTAEAVPPHFVDIARKYMEPYLDKTTFIEDESEIVPGLSAVPTPGHTPGHISILIQSGSAQMLHFSDAAIHPIHLQQSQWTVSFDVLPEKSLESRRMICDCAARDNILVFAHHFPPFPNLGHIAKHEDGWQWKPLDTTNSA